MQDEITRQTGLIQFTKMGGVSDLPSKVRALFATALRAEAQGDTGRALEQLDKAVTAEEAGV